ncbi:MAG: SMC family ATPase [Candidatus Promineifilaceae bacterium]|nr:SMC family ATPase [Candidatus Promineifilaceae bacterium]
MIPYQLELTNFLSYREKTTLDFEGIHLACISGLNGAGKSTLLDAITWALFGKSRSRSDDDLVNRAAARRDEPAEVRFTFILEDCLYRVIRQKQQGRTSVLEFQLRVGDGEWRTMSEGGVRATQGAIELLLRMNFDTFINASFFLQGQADEFTTKTAGKRKEILADLLSVNRWDRYQSAAAARRKQEEENLLILDVRLEEIDAELGEEEERRQTLADAQADLDALTERLRAQEKILEQMRRIEAAVQQQKKQVQNMRQGLTEAQGRLNRLRRTYGERQAERESHQALLDQEEAIVAQFASWQEAEECFSGWQEKAERYHRLQRERRPHELAVERARTRLQQRRSELEKQGERVAAMATQQEQVQAILAEALQALDDLSGRLEALGEKEEAWHEARATLQEMQSERRLWQQEIKQLQAKAQEVTQLQAERAAVAANLEEAEAALARLSDEMVELARMRERHATALADVDNLEAEQERLRLSMEKLKERLTKLEVETGGACPLCEQDLTEEHRLSILADVREEGRQQGDRFRTNRNRLDELRQEIVRLEQAIKDGPRLEREKTAQQRRQATAEARLDEIDRAREAWEEKGAPRLAALEEQLADDSALKEQEEALRALEEAVREKKTLDAEARQQQKRASEAEARLAEIRRSQREWEEKGEPELAAVAAQLADDRIAPEAQEALAQVDARIAELGYDEEAHRAARQQRDTLTQAPRRHQELRQAQAAVKPMEAALADLERDIAEQEKIVARLEKQHGEAVAQLEALTADEGDLRVVEEEVFALREQEVIANRRVGAAQQRLAVLDDLRSDRAELVATRAELSLLINRLKRLEKACGRDGVQALLIEQALPEIEEDANQLLERLTGGDMRVIFETQRELKSRDALIETLDIRISDAAGERPYENFSGGEQFRVNFAIRLALSKILAKRAGARLQMLVIDEGFGSQDPAGRQRLVEAINTVKEDFARILVITHINELKDAFPTRIEVEKRPSGSQLAIY